MKKAQKQHLDRVKKLMTTLVDFKYKRGAKEHKNSDPILAKSEEELAIETIWELVDGLIYLITLREKQMAKGGFKKSKK